MSAREEIRNRKRIVIKIGSSLMTYPLCFKRLSACEAVRTFSLLTGRGSRNPFAV